ncbi:MAG TPA: asparagine synthase (glutamine-hydrolyzing) [Candidatus Binatia bacterium]
MCGIYGYLSTKENVDPDILRGMGDTLRHRGPDGEGEEIQQAVEWGLGLGHTRLSIIDLSPAGKQPMCNEDGTIWITYNGEIYNFRELRTELEKNGHHFKSNSDTEVIIHLYEERGVRCLERLNGMFAFAIWDRSEKTLFLARDRIGKKPLHYALYDGGIIFGSEIKALLKHPKVVREIDLGSLNKYLSYEYVPAPGTIFKSIRKVRPGYFLLYKNGELRTERYWDIPLSDHPIGYKTEDEYVEELREILERSVRSRLVADVPVGVFLSGGLDSSLVAAMAKRSNKDIECFSIGFDEKSFDERKYAAKVAQSLNLKQNLRIFSTSEMLENLKELPRLLDEPLADASILPTYLLSKMTSEKLKVALSGDGGDELFAGYPTYQAHKLVTYFDSLPDSLKDAAKSLALSLPVSDTDISFDFKIKQFLRGAGVSSEIRFFRWMGGFIDSEKKELLSDDLKAALRRHNSYEDIFSYLSESGLTKDLERILYLSMKLYLQDDILVKVDRAAMANGLEVRCPLLDYEFVEFACRLPTYYKLKGLKTKYLLKTAARGILPDEIIDRRKKGFGIPIARWLRNELKDFMLNSLEETKVKHQGFFNYAYIKKLIDDHLEKKQDNRKTLWSLLVFQIWHETYLENP